MKLEDVFEQTHRLPTVPKVVHELIDSFGKPGIDLGDIASKIALDQVIAAKTLRLANSAHFATTHRIGSLHEAAMVLGFTTLRTLVVASGITGAFVATQNFDRRQFWRNSLEVAAYCRWLASLCKQDTEAAFTCGLIHNIGELLLHVVAPDIAIRIDKWTAEGGDRQALEDANIGFDYIEIGAELARRWSFPESFRLAILHQAAPLTHPECGSLGLILNLAISLSKLTRQAHAPEEIMAALPQDILAALNIDPAEFAARLADGIEETRTIEELVN
ncbi:HD-like signal output (HDOD) domain, no enzymatic activity [Formivibrio citricus]|uniref:HD-like signal output (HDOD) domain, no enzymatic activity n=1 Tax=Formivibrio citricus TaxID=83765 RepID=A0A1I4UZP9_9NEIS|nr:HDOD domain-containing protein [Formivibrio citricus]SFM94489.1 HD-like signal output (HDOD) domain, no enzymatic activity [Formivibrio citricus]